MTTRNTSGKNVPFPCERHLSRRNFLESSAAIAGMGALASSSLLGGEPSSPRPSDLVPRKDDRLIVRKTNPIVMGTPDHLLRKTLLTPKELLFVRTNFILAGYMTLAPKPLNDWTVEITGLVESAKMLAARELDDLPRVEHEMVIQCSGNGRSLFSKHATTTGTQWGRGAVGNVRFAGVTLATIFKHLDIKIDPGARFLTTEGLDKPEKAKSPDFEHGILLAAAMERSFLATHLNGEPLPAIHGGPLRLITPGYYATMHVKWVTRLRLESDETNNAFQLPKYRTPKRPIAPGEKFEFTFENSDPNWDMRIKSRLLSPPNGAPVPAGLIEVSGVAWNDGNAPLVAVETSTNLGKTWRRAKLKRSKSPWAWHDWSARVRLEQGTRSVWCRAVDALGRTQPIDGSIYWNQRGYTWNEVDKITLDVG